MLKKDKQQEGYSDEDLGFYTIIGYTSGGTPYGITMKEAVELGLLNEDEKENNTSNPFDLPF